MKKPIKFFVFLALIIPSLVGCNFSDKNGDDSHADESTFSSNQTSQPDVEYTADDIHYYSQAGQEIFNAMPDANRTYTKTYDGFCAVAIAEINGYYGPVLVGEDAVQVCFSQTYDSTITDSGGSIMYNGVEYFFSKADYFVHGSINWKIKYSNYCSKATTLEEVARDIASKANFIPVDDSLKKELIFTENNDGTLSVKAGPYTHGKTELIIPEFHDGKIVTQISPGAFEEKNEIESVVFPAEILSIGSGAFKGCTKLESIRIPKKVKTIGKNAFVNCSSLAHVTIPQSVTSIGDSAFGLCSSGLMIYCEAEYRPSGYYENYDSAWYGGYVWYGTTDYIVTDDYEYGIKTNGNLIITKYLGSDTVIEFNGVTSRGTIDEVGNGAFRDKNKITKIIFPNTINKICAQAFRGCSMLKEIKLPSSLEEIERQAFLDCKSLASVVIPRSVSIIGSDAFKSCSPDLIIFCEASSKPSGYFELSIGGLYWYGNAEVYYSGSWEYDSNGNPYLTNV